MLRESSNDERYLAELRGIRRDIKRGSLVIAGGIVVSSLILAACLAPRSGIQEVIGVGLGLVVVAIALQGLISAIHSAVRGKMNSRMRGKRTL